MGAATRASSLRETKKRKTRAELRRIAAELVAVHGFDGVTINQIVAEAQVAKSTFYRYFDSKEDVLLADPDERLEQLRGTLAGRPPAESVLVSVRHTRLEMADRFERERDELLEVSRLVVSTPALQAKSLEHQVHGRTSFAGSSRIAMTR